MFSARRRALLPTILLWTAAALGQVETADSPDPFQGLHATLSAAADRALASALADRPWMKADTAAGSPSTQPADAVAIVRIKAGIERVRRLRPVIAPILREEGIPPEMIAVALVESGGQLTALSSKGARGAWQFMPDTARRYGLTVTPTRDDRLDIVKSTRAAARYLRALHRQFGDWKLAFAAYNAGEGQVQRVIQRVGHRDFLAVRSLLPLETRNYVPAVVSAMSLFVGNGERLDLDGRSASGMVLYAVSDDR